LEWYSLEKESLKDDFLCNKFYCKALFDIFYWLTKIRKFYNFKVTLLNCRSNQLPQFTKWKVWSKKFGFDSVDLILKKSGMILLDHDITPLCFIDVSLRMKGGTLNFEVQFADEYPSWQNKCKRCGAHFERGSIKIRPIVVSICMIRAYLKLTLNLNYVENF
jgi:hypothetical protein